MDALAHEATVTTTLRWTGRGEGDESEGRQIGIRRVGRVPAVRSSPAAVPFSSTRHRGPGASVGQEVPGETLVVHGSWSLEGEPAVAVE